MGNIIDFPKFDKAVVEIERTEEFVEVAYELSDFINTLPISHADNDKLLELMVKQVKVAETGAFNFGFGMACKLKDLDKRG